MSEIENILKTLRGTREAELLCDIQSDYENIQAQQNSWYAASHFTCPDGCGRCCHNFEPDLSRSEALYFAAWLLENQNQVALNVAKGIFPFENGKTCLFHDFENPYHCSAYGGRAFICRLFGASSAYGKHGQIVWRPCKFFPAEKLHEYSPKLDHRQYTCREAEEILGQVPPAMIDFMEQSKAMTNDTEEPKPLREILPEMVRHLMWIIQMN